jgi:hypothetical protein
VTENTVGKQKMRLGRRENSINGLKNETASKTVITKGCVSKWTRQAAM